MSLNDRLIPLTFGKSLAYRSLKDSARLCLLLGASVIALQTQAAEAGSKPKAFKADVLELTFHSDEKTLDPNRNSDWEKFCEEFGKQFLIGRGPQGRGLFKRKSCRPMSEAPKAGLKSDWLMAFTSSDKKLSIQGFYKNRSIFIIPFPSVITPARLFSSPGSMQFAVAQVYRKLPAAWRISLPAGTAQWTLPAFDQSRMPGESRVSHMLFFTLGYDEEQNLWLPKLRAVAKAIQPSPIAQDKAASPFALPLVYLQAKSPRPKKVALWAQELHADLDADQGKNLIYLSDAPASSESPQQVKMREYISFSSIRYLTPVPEGKTAASQSSKFEYLLRLQKGALNGLSLAIEKSLSEEGDAANPSSFSFLRQSASWGISLGLDGQYSKVSSQFRLAPRIGLITLDSRLPVQTLTGEFDSPLTFRAKNQLELGGELNWQLQMDTYTLWLAAANKLSGYVLKKAGDAKVSNQRLSAVFHYRSPFEPMGITLGLEALLYLDWLSFQNDLTAPDDNQLAMLASAAESKAVSLTILYLGLGLSLNW